LTIGGLLLIATPDSACQNKHMFWMRDWYSALTQIGFKKLSYAKEKHFHGLSVVKINNFTEPGEEKRKELAEKMYILQDKHDLKMLDG
jgi:hypothetical protein